MDYENSKIIKEMLESIKIDYKMDDSLVKLAKADDESIQAKVTEDLKKKLILQGLNLFNHLSHDSNNFRFLFYFKS